MGLFDRVFGNDRGGAQRVPPDPAPGQDADAQAIARYRYLVRTAPPEAIEAAHAEAFARLTPEQRRRVLDELATELPPAERAAAERAGDRPDAVARVATRAELRQPGSLERAFGRVGAQPGGGMGFGGMLAGSFLASMAGTVLGTAIAHQFLDHHGSTDTQSDLAPSDSASLDNAGGDFGDAGSDFGGDSFDV
jgi:hypothetical protein